MADQSARGSLSATVPADRMVTAPLYGLLRLVVVVGGVAALAVLLAIVVSALLDVAYPGAAFVQRLLGSAAWGFWKSKLFWKLVAVGVGGYLVGVLVFYMLHFAMNMQARPAAATGWLIGLWLAVVVGLALGGMFAPGAWSGPNVRYAIAALAIALMPSTYLLFSLRSQ